MTDPVNFDTERHLLGALTWRPSNIPTVVDMGLEPGHFAHPHHRRRYGELIEAWIAGIDPDPGLARDQDGNIQRAPQVSRPDLYAAELLDLAHRRRQIAEAYNRPDRQYGWAEWWQARDRP